MSTIRARLQRGAGLATRRTSWRLRVDGSPCVHRELPLASGRSARLRVQLRRRRSSRQLSVRPRSRCVTVVTVARVLLFTGTSLPRATVPFGGIDRRSAWPQTLRVTAAWGTGWVLRSSSWPIPKTAQQAFQFSVEARFCSAVAVDQFASARVTVSWNAPRTADVTVRRLVETPAHGHAEVFGLDDHDHLRGSRVSGTWRPRSGRSSVPTQWPTGRRSSTSWASFDSPVIWCPRRSGCSRCGPRR